MKFPIAVILAAIASPLLVSAQATDGSNPFSIPTSGLNAKAGSTTTLTWKPTTQGTVTITLRQGANSNLDKGQVIADNIPNSGSYTWSVPSTIVRGSDYALEISTPSGNVNYTPQFVIDSSVTVATTTASSSGTATTGTTSGTMTTGTTGSTTGTATTGMTTGTSKTGSTSGTMTTSGTATSRSTNSASSAGFQSSSTSASAGGAPRATAAAGFMGLVALGAMAL